MNDILDIYESIFNTIEDTEDFRIKDFIYYLGITIIDKYLSKEEIVRLIDICKKVDNNKLNSLNLSKELTSIVYSKEYMTLEQLERVSIDTIQEYFLNDKMDEVENYYDSNVETITSTNEIKEGVSYTVARVIDNGYSVELHYSSNSGATIEYGTKKSYDYWENDIEEVDWFNTKLSDDYIIKRLECLYQERFSDIKLTEEQVEELNLIDKILTKHKVYDINLHITNDGNLIAYDDENYWIGNEFYDFMFNELFVYNKQNEVELIDKNDYKNLETFRLNYDGNLKENLEEEREF